jgi:ribosomal protein S27AE
MAAQICPNCGYQGTPKSITKGSFLIELVLWICFLIPGLIYSLWRVSSRTTGCPKCGAQHMIPLGSPKGQQLVRELAGPNWTPPPLP